MKVFTSLLFILLLSLGLQAQMFESKQELSVGTQSGFAMDYPGADKKMVESAIEDAVKKYGKVKRNKKAKEWYCQECNISSVSSTPLNVYYKIDEGDGKITSHLFFDNGQKFLVMADGDAKAGIEQLSTEIFHDVQRKMVNKELENEEDSLKDFEKDLKKLGKKNEDYNKDIEGYKEKIAKAEKELEKNLQEQEAKKLDIEKQKNKVDSVKEKLNNIGRL